MTSTSLNNGKPWIYPTKASAAHPKLISQGRHQNAKTSSYHSHPQITSLGKNPRANSLQSLITNLQLSTILSAQISSRPLHHPANPLYQILLYSHSLSRPPVTTHLKFSNRAISNTAPRLWTICLLNSALCSVLPPSSPIIHCHVPFHHPKAFHSKLKSHLFKNS